MNASSRTRLTRTESQQATRQRLIESASQLFADAGVRGTSLIAVAENAGFSRGAVHGNFSDKDELASAVVQFIVADLGPELTRALNIAGPTNDRLAAYISTHIDYCRREPTRTAAIIAAVGYLGRPTRTPAMRVERLEGQTGVPESQTGEHAEGNPTEDAESYGQRSADSVADLVGLFTEGQRRGEMRDFDANAMALSLRAVLDTAVPTHTNIDAGEIIALFDHATRAQEA